MSESAPEENTVNPADNPRNRWLALYVLCVGVLGDGRVVSGSMDYSLRVWDNATGKWKCQWHLTTEHADGVYCI